MFDLRIKENIIQINFEKKILFNIVMIQQMDFLKNTVAMVIHNNINHINHGK